MATTSCGGGESEPAPRSDLPPAELDGVGPVRGPFVGTSTTVRDAYGLRSPDGRERWFGSNPANRLQLEVTGATLSLLGMRDATDFRVEMIWAGLGRGAQRMQIPARGWEVRAEGARAVSSTWGPFRMWTHNLPAGVEHAFEIDRAPGPDHSAASDLIPPSDGIHPLELELRVTGANVVTDATGRGLSLQVPAGPTLRYTGLLAFDVDRRPLTAWFEGAGSVARVLVDDRGARYPLWIDPLVWTEQQQLAQSDTQGAVVFGGAVALEQGTAVVGAAGVPLGTELTDSLRGAAYVFERAATEWTQQGKLTGEELGSVGDGFGAAVAISGSRALVGAAWWDSPTEPGAAYVFERVGSTWIRQATLSAPEPVANDRFGLAVALEGDTAIVSAPGDSELAPDAGAVYVFTYADAQWSLDTKLFADTDPEPTGDKFGSAIALSGNWLIVGARTDGDDGLEGAGSALLFRRDATSWIPEQELHGNDRQPEDRFGAAVAIRGDRALVGARGHTGHLDRLGAVAAFVCSADSWQFEQELLAPHDDAPGFGFSVSLSDRWALVGALDENSAAPLQPGAAFVFGRQTNGWAYDRELVPDVGLASGAFGTAVGVADGADPTQDQLLVGAPFEDGVQGAAFLFVHDRFAVGDPCEAGEQCESTYCVDGVCCSEACGGDDPLDCQACSTAGVCEPLADGHSCDDGIYCNGADECAAETCSVHAGDPCPGPDGDEDCRESCDEVAAGCTDPDDDDDACLAGRCRLGACVKDDGAGCAEDAGCLSGHCVEGICCEVTSCAPFRCGPAGACRETCSSTSDCAAGFQCDSAGRCVAEPSPVDADGCSCRLAASARGSSVRGRLHPAGLIASLFMLGGWRLAARRRRHVRAPP